MVWERRKASRAGVASSPPARPSRLGLRTSAALIFPSALIGWKLAGHASNGSIVPVVLYGLLVPVAVGVFFAPEPPRPRYLLASLRLWRAMSRGEIVYHYQPIIRLCDGVPVAAEALARWLRPKRGLLPPAGWLPATEGWLEKRFNRYTLRAIIAQAARWRADGRKLRVAVNLSPRSLTDPSLPGWIVAELKAAGIPPRAIKLEVTEAILHSDPTIEQVVYALSDAGLQLELDDFGIGHSSMERIVTLPISALKVDRMFVSDFALPRRASVVRAATGLCRELGMTCAAEGVETQETLEAIRKIGCDYAQGYLISPPQPSAMLEGWLDSDRAHIRSPVEPANTGRSTVGSRVRPCSC